MNFDDFLSRLARESNVRVAKEMLAKYEKGCTCLIGTSFSVTDPWCPEHRVVMDLTGFVTTDQGDECQHS